MRITISIQDIVLPHTIHGHEKKIYPRISTRLDKVQEYAEAMREGHEFAPIIVSKPTSDGKYILIDGFHRHSAMLQINAEEKQNVYDEIEVEMVDIAPDDIVGLMCEAAKYNAVHGIPLSREEKRAIVLRLFQEGMDAQEIAKRTCIPHRTVYRWVKEYRDKTIKDVEEKVIDMWSRDVPQYVIADELGISRHRVKKIINDRLSSKREGMLRLLENAPAPPKVGEDRTGDEVPAELEASIEDIIREAEEELEREQRLEKELGPYKPPTPPPTPRAPSPPEDIPPEVYGSSGVHYDIEESTYHNEEKYFWEQVRVLLSEHRSKIHDTDYEYFYPLIKTLREEGLVSASKMMRDDNNIGEYKRALKEFTDGVNHIVWASKRILKAANYVNDLKTRPDAKEGTKMVFAILECLVRVAMTDIDIALYPEEKKGNGASILFNP